jgi:hypothetical protein
VQQQDRCTLPGFGEIVDVIGELQTVACLEGLHRNLLDFTAVLADASAIIYDIGKSGNRYPTEMS